MVQTHKRCIYLVEDDQAIAAVLTLTLQDFGFEVLHFSSGDTFLDTFEKQPNTDDHLVLLDLELPGIKGTSILHHLRRGYSAIEFPIIVCSSMPSNKSIVEVLKLGANDYIVKPLDADVLHEKIKNQFQCQNLYQEHMNHLESKSIKATVVSYSHQLSTPLFQATTALYLAKKNPDQKYLSGIEKGLLNISKVVNDMKKITDFNYQKISYNGETDMIMPKKNNYKKSS